MMVVTGAEFKTAETQATIPVQEIKTKIEDYAGKYKMTGLPFDYIEISVKHGKVIMDVILILKVRFRKNSRNLIFKI